MCIPLMMGSLYGFFYKLFQALDSISTLISSQSSSLHLNDSHEFTSSSWRNFKLKSGNSIQNFNRFERNVKISEISKKLYKFFSGRSTYKVLIV